MAKELDIYIKSGGTPKHVLPSSDQEANHQTTSQPSQQSDSEQSALAISSSGANTGNTLAVSSFFASRHIIYILACIQIVLNIGLIFFIFKINAKIDQLFLGNSDDEGRSKSTEL